MSPKQNSVISSVRGVFRGIKETFVVVVLGKPVRPNFTPEEKETKKNSSPPSDETPTNHISDEHTLYISQEYQQTIIDFMKNAKNLDTLEIPPANQPLSAALCADNVPCRIEVSLIPRILPSQTNQERPQLKYVMVVTFTNEYGETLQADYGFGTKSPQQDFENDIFRLTPIALQDNTREEMLKKLSSQLPGLNFDSPPLFYMNNSQTEDFVPKGESL